LVGRTCAIVRVSDCDRSIRVYGRKDVLVGVVHLDVVAEELLLALLVGPVAANLVAVLFGLEKRDEVDARPHLFTSKLAEEPMR
jgi:hypothetical protein